MTPVGAVVAVVNQKGGVGKTTVTMGLASAALERGHKVLVVDLDPQGASTWVLGLDPSATSRGVIDVLGSSRAGSAKQAIVASEWSHLVDVLPASPGLQQLEVLRSNGLDQLLGGSAPAARLRNGLKKVTPGYGVVLIDCPPSLGSLTANGLTAADQALIVVEPTALSLRGVAPVADLIESVWESHNGELDLAGVIVNRMPGRSIDAAAHRSELARTVGESSLWEPSIPHRVVVTEAAAHRRPIHAMGARGAAVAQVFDQLYDQLWKRIRPTRK